MSSTPHNRLADQTSPYLRTASRQPVHWFPWGTEAFETARTLDRPILLDIGAVWCHWCHVMDQESYENLEIAHLINDRYIPIKVDRDERPDIDSRYQIAVGAMTGQGGWPLTVFLLPDGRSFFGGTYFPPDDRYGRPGFPRVLEMLAEAYAREHDRVAANASAVMEAVQQASVRAGANSLPGAETIDLALGALARAYDARHGGFGGSPKFPHAPAIEFLLTSYRRKPETWMLDAVRKTLSAMAEGGMYDHLGGGFHRYSTDERWTVPHFEKMLYDQSQLMSVYADTHRLTHDPRFRRVALETAGYCLRALYDSDRGGFGGSQDADVSPGDDGSYYTWTEHALNELPARVRAVVRLRYHVHDRGEMPHDQSHHVLFLDKGHEEIAELLHLQRSEMNEIVHEAQLSMMQLRYLRQEPYVDRTVYASWNGMMISALCRVFAEFHEPAHRAAALLTAQRLAKEFQRSDGLVTHTPPSRGGIPFLDDQVFVAQGFLDLHAVTGDMTWLSTAEQLLRSTIVAFGDPEGGFYDLLQGSVGPGYLSSRSKPIQDAPTPGANAAAIRLCLRFHQITGDDRFRETAERSLRIFAGMSAEHALFHSTYLLALLEYLDPPQHIVLIGDTKAAEQLRTTALTWAKPGAIITSYDSGDSDLLPPYLRSLLIDGGSPVALLCSKFACSTLVGTPADLQRLFQISTPTNSH